MDVLKEIIEYYGPDKIRSWEKRKIMNKAIPLTIKVNGYDFDHYLYANAICLEALEIAYIFFSQLANNCKGDITTIEKHLNQINSLDIDQKTKEKFDEILMFGKLFNNYEMLPKQYRTLALCMAIRDKLKANSIKVTDERVRYVLKEILEKP